nr:MAG TPA: hypothetical protein [Caudoviricetes sp.]
MAASWTVRARLKAFQRPTHTTTQRTAPRAATRLLRPLAGVPRGGLVRCSQTSPAGALGPSCSGPGARRGLCRFPQDSNVRTRQ